MDTNNKNSLEFIEFIKDKTYTKIYAYVNINNNKVYSNNGYTSLKYFDGSLYNGYLNYDKKKGDKIMRKMIKPKCYNNLIEWQVNKSQNVFKEYIQINTNKHYILDVDNMDLFKKHNIKLYNKLLNSCIYHTSRNKNLPHFWITLNFKPDKTCFKINDNEKNHYADLCCGLGIWVDNEKNEFEFNYDGRDIIELGKKDLLFECDDKGSDDELIDIPAQNDEEKYDIKQMKKLLNCLSVKRWDNYDSWYKLMYFFAYYFDNKFKGLNLFIRYSQKSDKFDEDDDIEDKYLSCINKIKNGLTHHIKIGTVINWAKEDNIDLYIEWSKLVGKNEKIELKPFDKRKMIELIKEQHKNIDDKNLFNKAYNYYKQYFIKISDGKTQYYKIHFDNENNKKYIVINSSKELIELEREYYLLSEKKKKLRLIDLWLDDIEKINYTKINYMPNVFNKYDPYSNNNIFNLWQGWNYKIEPNYKYNENDFDLITKHLYEVLCDSNKELYEYILNWCSYVLKGCKTGIGLYFAGDQGGGKNIFWEFFGTQILGKKYYSYFANIDNYLDKFNDMKVNKSLHLCDEMNNFCGNHKQANILKSMLTQTQIRYEKKYQSAKNIDDHCNTVFLSNFFLGVKVEGKKDRRYCCAKINNKYCKNQEYFNKLRIQMNIPNKCKFIKRTNEEKLIGEKACKSFFHFLMARDLNNVNLEIIPNTPLRQQMIENSTPDVLKFFRCLLTNMQELLNRNDKKKDINISMTAVWKMYSKFCKNNGHILKFGNAGTLSKNILNNHYLTFLRNYISRKRTGSQITFFKIHIDKFIEEMDKHNYFNKEEISILYIDNPCFKFNSTESSYFIYQRQNNFIDSDSESDDE